LGELRENPRFCRPQFVKVKVWNLQDLSDDCVAAILRRLPNIAHYGS